jgi:hypothetical protein
MQSRVGELVSWEFNESKVLKLKKECFELRIRVKMKEKFDFSHLKNLDGMEKLENSNLDPLSSQKLN